jgi:hypothetical protein
MRCFKCGREFEKTRLTRVWFRRHAHYVCRNCRKFVGRWRPKGWRPHEHSWKTVLSTRLYVNGKPVGSLEELVCEGCGKRLRRDENWSDALKSIKPITAPTVTTGQTEPSRRFKCTVCGRIYESAEQARRCVAGHGF